jgi:hypothetical protein
VLFFILVSMISHKLDQNDINALPSHPQVGRSMSNHRIFPYHDPKNSKALLIPYREIFTHINLHGIPLLYKSGDRTSRLREFYGRESDSRISETGQPVNAKFFLSRFYLLRFHHSRCQDTCFTDSRTSIRQTSDVLVI